MKHCLSGISLQVDTVSSFFWLEMFVQSWSKLKSDHPARGCSEDRNFHLNLIPSQSHSRFGPSPTSALLQTSHSGKQLKKFRWFWTKSGCNTAVPFTQDLEMLHNMETRSHYPCPNCRAGIMHLCFSPPYFPDHRPGWNMLWLPSILNLWPFLPWRCPWLEVFLHLIHSLK